MNNKFMDGRFLEDFLLGEVFRHKASNPITEADNAAFCSLTANPHPLHTQAAFAAQTRYGQRVVPGTFVLSLAVGLSVEDISYNGIANLGYEQVIHNSPVFIGDSITAETTILSVTPSRHGKPQGVVKVMTRAFNQKGELVLTFQRSVLIPTRAKQGCE
jgi:itaconyl-CoA hydratase